MNGTTDAILKQNGLANITEVDRQLSGDVHLEPIQDLLKAKNKYYNATVTDVEYDGSQRSQSFVEALEAIAILRNISTWQPRSECIDGHYGNGEGNNKQMDYDSTIESEEGLSIQQLLTLLGDMRRSILRHSTTIHIWTKEEVYKFLEIMSNEATEQFAERNTDRQRQNATVIQLRILEEVDNNWESVFLEDEHVWDIASKRTEPEMRGSNGAEVEMDQSMKRFFSMRTWLVDDQSAESQTEVMRSSPKVAEKTEPMRSIHNKNIGGPMIKLRKPKEKTVRHIRGRQPCFPFGETPFQQAYMSYQMEQELAKGNI